MSEILEAFNMVCASLGLAIIVVIGNEWWDEKQEDKRNKRK